MRTLISLQPDYTANQGYYQIKLPIAMEIMIPADDPVRLLSAFVEGMDLSELCSKKLFSEVASILYELGEVSGKTIFIDGTKIESRANKYTFVWKKAVTKFQARLIEKILLFIGECETQYGIRIVYDDTVTPHTLKRLLKKLYQIKEEENIAFAYGTGHRKSQLQRSIETLEGYITRLEEYIHHLNVSRVMKEKRQETLDRITTEYGTQLRMNRSIQAEGSFAVIKEDMNFRRYLYRGKENVLAQSILLPMLITSINCISRSREDGQVSSWQP